MQATAVNALFIRRVGTGDISIFRIPRQQTTSAIQPRGRIRLDQATQRIHLRIPPPSPSLKHLTLRHRSLDLDSQPSHASPSPSIRRPSNPDHRRHPTSHLLPHPPSIPRIIQPNLQTRNNHPQTQPPSPNPPNQPLRSRPPHKRHIREMDALPLTHHR